MARRRSGGDLAEINPKAQSATQGIKSLSSAFDGLSKSGRLSAQSIMQFAGAAGQVNPVLGIAVAGIGLFVRQAERLRELDLADQMKQIAAGTESAALQMDKLTAGLTAGIGETGAVKVKLQELAEVQALIAARARRYANEVERIERIEDTESRIARAAQAEKIHRDRMRHFTEKQASIEREISLIRLLTPALDAQEQKERALAKAVEMHADAQLRKVQAIEAEIAAETDAHNRIREADIQFLMAQDEQSEAARIRRIEAMETEAATYELLGDIAANAIGQTAAGAFNAYADALDETVSLNAIFAGGFDRTMRNMAASTIRSVGQQAMIKGSFELAESIAAYARYDTVSGSGHLSAAGKYFAVAAIAGVAAGGMSVKPSGSGGGRRGGGGGGDDGGSSGPRVSVTVIGSLDDSAANDLGRRIAEAMSRSDS